MKKALLAAALFSVSLALAAKEPEKKFDRGLGDASSVFVPKGMMTVGASISYHHYSAGNGDVGYELMSLITGMEGNLSTVKVSPALFYFIGKNTAVGARFGYSYTSMDMDKASISLDSDNEFDLSNHYLKNQSYSGQFAVRNYVPLFGSRVFAMFNEVRIGGTKSQGKAFQYDGDEKNGTFSDGYALNIGVYPGVTVFLTNSLSFELALSVLECNYSYTKQTKTSSPACRRSCAAAGRGCSCTAGGPGCSPTGCWRRRARAPSGPPTRRPTASRSPGWTRTARRC